MKQKILCLVSHYPDPLINRRIKMLKEQFDVTIFYSLRHNEKFVRIDEVTYVESKSIVQNKNIFKRLKWILNEKNEIQQIIKKDKFAYIYCFGLDMLMFIKFLDIKCKKVIYEVADLHDIIINNSRNLVKIAIKNLIRRIEKNLCKKVDFLVVTSVKFYDIYFSKFIEKDKLFFMPNMPDIQYFKQFNKQKNNIFTIGFIGGVRYKKQMKLLIEAADKLPIKVFFAGYSQDNEIEEMVKNKENIEFYGRYNYNTEIAKLYSQCDCIYSIYDTEFNNVKYALPNKLYETIYCEIPILVAKDTFLAEEVERLGIGLAVDSKSLDDLVEKILMLQNNKLLYDKLVQNCKNNKEDINIDKYNMEFIKKIKMEKI